MSRGIRRVRVVLSWMLAVTLLTATPAYASWPSSGSGSGSGSTGTLLAPTNVTVPAFSPPSVSVSWTASSGATTPTGYYVTRIGSGGPAAACASGPGTLLGGTSCTDTGVANGTYTYTVTAVYQSWTALSAPSGTVTVTTATALAFSGQPSDVAASAAITPPVTVQLKNSVGTSIFTAGIAVTIAIGTNPGGGTLSGTATALTNASGVATFAGLSINNPGAGYTLIATSPGMTSATSAAFTVFGPGEAPVGLGTAATYSVLGGQTVTNTGPTVLSANLGVSPGTAFTGFPPGTVGGTIHAADAHAAQAQLDLTTAYTDAAGRTPTAIVAGDLAGQTLIPGVYQSASSLAVNGTLTLDGRGDPNAVFIFQMGSTLTTATASTVNVINGAQACNVFWQVGSSATLGTYSTLRGTIIALTSITVTTGVVVYGRALARNGAVTLDSNTFHDPDCA